MNKKIIFSTGGTGGHIFPAVNLMKHFFDEGYNVLLVTDIRGENYIKDVDEKILRKFVRNNNLKATNDFSIV